MATARSGVMKLVAVRVFLAVLMAGDIANNLVYANEWVKQEEFLHVDETRHQWVNERNGRTGMLIVSGALLSSPCTLETNEIDLHKDMQPQGMLERYVFKLKLVGCGDGDAKMQASHDKTIATQSALLYKRKGGQPAEQKMLSNGRVALENGRNHLIYYMNKNQRKALISQHRSDHTHMAPLASNSLLHLLLGYE